MREQFGHREDALEPGQVDAGLDRRAQQLVAVVGLRRAGAADVAEADPESLCAYRVEDPRIAGIGAADRVGDRDCRRAKLRSQPGLAFGHLGLQLPVRRSEEHTSELQSLMRNSYAVFCLK